MSKKEQNKIREQLLTKLAELGGKRDRRNDLKTEWSNEEMDQVQSRADLDLTVRFFNSDFQTKRAVETALRLLDEGEYGVCMECGDEINPKRLAAIPWTTMCVNCQEMHDDVEIRRAA